MDRACNGLLLNARSRALKLREIMGKKTIYFDAYCGYMLAAVTENGKVTEFEFEKKTEECAVGNVYKGKVQSVHTGMQAAFIDCGLGRNCFLPLTDENDYEKDEIERGTVPPPALKAGDEILVQITKLPVGKKGAKVTVHPSFIGKCLIYMPEYPFVGVSRKITDGELRNNIAYTARRLKGDDEGLIMRTAAPYARHTQLKLEFAYLKNISAQVKEAFKTAKVGQLLYTDVAMPIRVLRDTLSTDIEAIFVGTPELKTHVENLVSLYPAQSRRPVYLHDSGRDMLEETGVSRQIESIISPRVELDNGSYLIIEKTEALTVIDVNTGKFTGDYSLEQTVYHTNIAAAREIARQVKLRNIGGIVVVDFIDMQNAAHNKSLVQELERSLKSDKAKCTVAPMSQFGLVEFTRKRIGVSPLSLMINPCAHCGESGFTLSDEYILMVMRAKILAMLAEGAKALRLDMNAKVHARLVQWEELKADLKKCGADIYSVPHRTYHEEYITYSTDISNLPEIGRAHV